MTAASTLNLFLPRSRGRFAPGAGVAAGAVLPDGAVVIGGGFSVAGDGIHHGLARLFGGPPVPPFFAGQRSIGEQSYALDFFGTYRWDYFPFVYHTELGFQYFVDAGDAQRGGYFYDYGLQTFLYTAPGLFPYCYDFSARAFLYYFRGTTRPRVFANTGTGKFIFSP